MNLEQKKKLAEWMGWEIIKRPNGNDVFFGINHYFVRNWNPDTNYVQFFEVWDKLTQSQKLKALGYTAKKDLGSIVVPLLNVLTAISKLKNDASLSELMDAVLEVLEIAKEK